MSAANHAKDVRSRRELHGRQAHWRPLPRRPGVPRAIRSGPPPLRGGPLTLLRFARRNHMLTIGYARLVAKWLWLKLRWRGRLRTDGLCFVCPGVKLEIGKHATLTLGRWSWIGHGCKIRVHEGGSRDRRQVGARTGVHDLGLPARVDRPRMHRRRPGDADRLRPRGRRGRAPRSACRHLQARRRRRPTTCGSATARASCAA